MTRALLRVVCHWLSLIFSYCTFVPMNQYLRLCDAFFFPSDIKSWNRWLILWHLFLFIYSCFRDRWFIFIFIRNRHFISRSWRETYKNHLSWNIVWQHNLRSILYIYQFNWYDILTHKFTRNPQINALFMVSRREMQYYVL